MTTGCLRFPLATGARLDGVDGVDVCSGVDVVSGVDALGADTEPSVGTDDITVAVVWLSSHGRNSSISERDPYRLCPADAPTTALPTGAAKNRGSGSMMSPWASFPGDLLRRRYHQPRSARRITATPPTTPPAIAAALLWCRGMTFGGPVGDWLGVDEVEDDVGAGGLDTGALELVPLAPLAEAPLAEAPLAEGPLAEGPLTEDAAAEISRLAWAKT